MYCIVGGFGVLDVQPCCSSWQFITTGQNVLIKRRAKNGTLSSRKGFFLLSKSLVKRCCTLGYNMGNTRYNFYRENKINKKSDQYWH